MRSIHPLAFLPVSSGLLVLILSLALAVNKLSSPSGLTSQRLSAGAADSNASMAILPSSGTFSLTAVGSYPVGIVVDSAGKPVSGVDAVVFFDPARLSVSGKVSAGTLLESYPVLTADNVKGVITVSAVSFEPRPISGILATFRFIPKTIGPAAFKIDFTPSSRTDSNIVSADQRDILAKVDGATYQIQ